jgi:hypothetical protein
MFCAETGQQETLKEFLCELKLTNTKNAMKKASSAFAIQRQTVSKGFSYTAMKVLSSYCISYRKIRKKERRNIDKQPDIKEEIEIIKRKNIERKRNVYRVKGRDI